MVEYIGAEYIGKQTKYKYTILQINMRCKSKTYKCISTPCVGVIGLKSNSYVLKQRYHIMRSCEFKVLPTVESIDWCGLYFKYKYPGPKELLINLAKE